MKITLAMIIEFILLLAQKAEEYLGAGTGEEKKKAVVDFVVKVLPLLGINLPAIVMQNLPAIIDLAVAFANAIGLFFKKK